MYLRTVAEQVQPRWIEIQEPVNQADSLQSPVLRYRTAYVNPNFEKLSTGHGRTGWPVSSRGGTATAGSERYSLEERVRLYYVKPVLMPLEREQLTNNWYMLFQKYREALKAGDSVGLAYFQRGGPVYSKANRVRPESIRWRQHGSPIYLPQVFGRTMGSVPFGKSTLHGRFS